MDSGVSLSVSLQDFPEAAAMMHDIIRRGENRQLLMEGIGKYNEDATKRRITTTNTGPDGKAWLPSLRVRLNGGKTLFLSAGLHDSISSEATQDEAVWGTNKIYARAMQFGATIVPKVGKVLRFRLPSGGFVSVKKVVIPARPYIGISDEDKKIIAGMIEDYWFDGLQGLA